MKSLRATTTERCQQDNNMRNEAVIQGKHLQGGTEGNSVAAGQSLCPSCSKTFESALILPCSHTLCAGCVERLAASGRGQGGCVIPCPCCDRDVELPCWHRETATQSLPVDPTQGCTRDLTEGGDKQWGGAIDLCEDVMQQSVSGLVFAMDPSTAGLLIRVSNTGLAVSFGTEHSEDGELLTDPDQFPYVCSVKVITRGQFYWEVDVCNSHHYRIGVISVDGRRGWWLERYGCSFSAVSDERRELLSGVPPQIKTVGLFLNMGGGALSFHNTLTQEHLTTLPSRFGPALKPALGLGHGRLRLRCGLPPPPHIFLSHSSTYRQPAGMGHWRRDAPFRSIHSIIQKFEELSVSDSDSGLVSSFGSCSTLSSLSEVRGQRFP